MEAKEGANYLMLEDIQNMELEQLLVLAALEVHPDDRHYVIAKLVKLKLGAKDGSMVDEEISKIDAKIAEFSK
ncbi:hypothetical protein HN784_02950 [bacterium]|jgi:hypothetical protein|nr:hypothetical protein [bacterium]MBT7038187.1 hypothetical protein [bacterium]MBT7431772.1 hypothetical protein [bacterium]